MRKFVLASLVSLGVGSMLCGSARAQLGSYNRPMVNPRPTVSPYVNMFSFANPAAAYFGIVRPEQQFGQTLNALQNQYQNMQGTLNQLGNAPLGQENLLMTGHPVMFMNYSYYFPMMSGRGGMAGGGGGIGMGGLGAGGLGTGGFGLGIVGMPTGTGVPRR